MEDLSIIVGLGNPGNQYLKTRHNAGFLVVDRFAAQLEAEWLIEKRFKSMVARGAISGRKVLLAKPQTYMNASGDAVAAIIRYFQVSLSNLIVVVDDADLNTGTVRLRPGGGSGGHHGLESIINQLGGRQDFARLRVGIGRTNSEQREIAGHVLGQFDDDEWPRMHRVFARATEQISVWLQSGLQKAMNQYNGVVENPIDERDSL